MKKVINGKRYDTETATECGSMSYGEGTRDFRHYSETLYQKRTGEFFLYGEGGPMSQYAEETALNQWSGGEKITPLTEAEARQWAEKNLDGDDYEKIFSVEEPEEGAKICSFSLDGESISKLTQLSRASGLSRSKIICDLIAKAYQERQNMDN